MVISPYSPPRTTCGILQALSYSVFDVGPLGRTFQWPLGFKMARVWRLACFCAFTVCTAMFDHVDRVLRVQELREAALATKGNISFQLRSAWSEHVMRGDLYRFPTCPTRCKAGGNKRKRHSSWEVALVYDIRAERQSETSAFMKRAGTRCAWLVT